MLPVEDIARSIAVMFHETPEDLIERISEEVRTDASSYTSLAGRKKLCPTLQDAQILEIKNAEEEILLTVRRYAFAGNSYSQIKEKLKENSNTFSFIATCMEIDQLAITKAEDIRDREMAACREANSAACKGFRATIPTYDFHARPYLRVKPRNVEIVHSHLAPRPDYYHSTTMKDLEVIFRSNAFPAGVSLSTAPDPFHIDRYVVVLKHDVAWRGGPQKGARCWSEPETIPGVPHCYLFAKEADVKDIKQIAVSEDSSGTLIAKTQKQVDQWIAANPALRGTKIDVVNLDILSEHEERMAAGHGVHIPADSDITIRRK